MARVLVVADDPDTLLQARIDLGRAGHEIALAADGAQAEERLAAGPFDVVVVAVGLPMGDLGVPFVELAKPVTAEAIVAAVQSAVG